MTDDAELPRLEPVRSTGCAGHETVHLNVEKTLRNGGPQCLSDAWRIMIYVADRPDMNERVMQWAKHYGASLGFSVALPVPVEKSDDGGDVGI